MIKKTLHVRIINIDKIKKKDLMICEIRYGTLEMHWFDNIVYEMWMNKS